MQAQLSKVIGRFQTAERRIHQLVDSLPAERWALRSSPDRWSVAECVAHLNLTGRAYVPLIRDALEEARGRDEPSRPRYRRDPVGWMLALAMGPVPQIGRFRLGAVEAIGKHRLLDRIGRFGNRFGDGGNLIQFRKVDCRNRRRVGLGPAGSCPGENGCTNHHSCGTRSAKRKLHLGSWLCG